MNDDTEQQTETQQPENQEAPQSALEAIERSVPVRAEETHQHSADDPNQDKEHRDRENQNAEGPEPENTATPAEASDKKSVAEDKDGDQEPDNTDRALTEEDLELTAEEQTSLSQGSQARFRKLANGVKAANDRAVEYEQQAQALQKTLEPVQQMFTDSKLAADEIAELFEYGRALKTGDLAAAGKILLRQVKEYQLLSGQPLQLEDPLGDFPDLRKQVNDMGLNEAAALEMAKARRLEADQKHRQTQQRESEHRQAQQQQTVQKAVQDIDAWAAQTAASDVDWPQKEKLISARIARITQSGDPSSWLPQIENLYDTISSMSVSQPPPKKDPAPLTSSAGNAGGRAPANGAEAALQALNIRY
ncbi:hypothetical protein [Microbulbifer discodermiae]|uniref:hypothetical protein n=1 Tax=Microbulbifer sp. 2201CG32-9 TaxID=3232309 RepID=UPI00345BA3F1